jgi:NADH dehydrogenase
MAPGKVTVFGGTGFLGRRAVQRLLERDFSVRVAARHPERIAALFPDVRLEAVHADINDNRSVAAAVAGVEGVLNAVSLYRESGPRTFHSFHVEGSARVAEHARKAGVERFILVSGIGSDAGSASHYIRSRGEGEKVVREAFPAATVIRPSVMFGRGDAFLVSIARMLRRLPVFPLLGRGQTQLQPAHVEDVALAIAKVMHEPWSPLCYELGGPCIYTYRSLLEVMAQYLGKKPILVPMPFSLWHTLAFVTAMLPEPPVTRNQVELMQLDNVVSPGALGFADLRISAISVEDALPEIAGLVGASSAECRFPIVRR